LRAFVAVAIDSEIKASLIDLVGRLRSLGEGVGWVRPNAVHLTLKFLGEVSDDRAHAAGRCLEEIASRHGTFPLSVKGTGVFPPGASRPRILWAGIDPSPSLMCFQEDVESTLEKSGFPREAKAFHPHLTLGRVRKPAGLGRILELLKEHRESEFGVMTADTVTLFESRLHPSGAQYAVLREVRLP
jgi:RNA 2',3'-cyclic 3'-phosphodiesterase